jgi:hypothetical protein
MTVLALAPLLLVAAAAEPPPLDDTVEDIVVIARKFESVTLALRKTGTGSIDCKVTRSSGDREIDQLSCLAATSCSTRVAVSRSNRLALEDCIKAERLTMISDLVAARQPKAP